MDKFNDIFKKFEPTLYGTAFLWKLQKFSKDEINMNDWDKLTLKLVVEKLKKKENPMELLNN